MKNHKVILNTSFITLNEYINIERSNKYAAASAKEAQTNKVAYLANANKLKLPKDTKFDVHFTWFKPNNRQDHDNIAFAKKFVFDGLVKANILKNDNPRFIRNLSDSFEICKHRSYVSCIVTFTEVEK